MTLTDCPSWEALGRYSVGDLLSREAQSVDSHVGSCTACLGRLDDLANRPDQFIALLRQSPSTSAEPDPALWEALATVLAGKDPPIVSELAGPGAGSVLNGYRILDELGSGGLGRVYRAVHPRLDQEVALKIMRPGSESASRQARFQAELHALTRMDHPYVARVLDGGTTEQGQPFIVMELVRGTALTRYCDDRRLAIRHRLELFILICHAVQHAHQKGIIHRDLKPSNVLVADLEGRPVPKVIDFGVARIVGRSAAQTEFGMLVGTLEYMSPEQASLDSTDIDTRSDVYSLGVLLYELLTGATPLGLRAVQKPTMEVLRLVREEEPIAPSTLLGRAETCNEVAARRDAEPFGVVKQVRGELDWIVLKALDKNRSRRYETAVALADDVRRYLQDEPVSAGPPSRAYLVKKFIRRHKGAVLAAGLLLFALVGGTVGTSLGLVRAEYERAIAETERANAETERTNAEIARANAETERANAVAERDQKNTVLINLGEEQTRTKAALLAETQARMRALAALRNLSDEIVVRQLGRQATLTPQMKAFVETVLTEYEALAATRGDTEESRAIRAEGNFQVAVMQARLGAAQQAVTSFERARDLFQALARDFPSAPDYRRNLARARNNLGTQLFETGKFAEGAAEFQAALELFVELAKEFPYDPEYLRLRGSAHAGLGNVANARGNRPAAEAEYRKSIELRTRIVKEHPGNPDYRQEEAGCRTALASLLKEMGKRPEAATEYRLAFALLEPLLVEYAGVPAYRQELSIAHRGLGTLLEAMNKRGEAETEYRAALHHAKQLAARFPSMPIYRYDLVNCHDSLANLLRKEDRREDAIAEQRQSLALARELLTDFPANLDYVLRYGGSCCNHGNVLSEHGNHAESLEWYQKAIDTLKPLVEKQPEVAKGRRFLRNSYWGRAKALMRQDKFAASMVAWDLAIAAEQESDTRSLQFGRAACRARIEPEQAVADADRLLAGANVVALHFYHAARVYAHASVHVPSEELKGKYGKRAVTLLRRARYYLQVPANWAKVQEDPDLDPLRHREDFKKMVADLELGAGGPK